MLVKMLKAVGDRQPGDTIHVHDDVAKAYIDGGLAKAAGDGGSALDSLSKSIERFATLVETQASTANHVRDAKVHQGEYTSPDGELNGLAVFGSKGGFLHAVREVGINDQSDDTRKKVGDWNSMQAKAGLFKGAGSPSGMNEATDPDGGLLVIPEFSQQIYERSIVEENFLAEADVTVIKGNTLQLLGLDDASRANGSRWGGIQGYWANEAEQFANASRPKFRPMDLRLKKLYVIAYITDELLADSAFALEQRVMKGAAKELAFKCNDAMVSGGGAGVPLGITQNAAAIAVSKETGQAANTILIQNIENMWMRLNPAYRKSAQWLINLDCEKQLQMMAFPVGIGGVPIYQPVGGVSNPSYSTLKGRPVKPVEFCETLGTQGDIILTSWDGYTAITKGGVQTDMSMHVRFLFGEMAFRFTFRMDGQPLWDKPLTPYKGTTTTSTTVVLATRA